MIQEIRVTSVEELIPLLSDQPYRPDLGRNRSLYVYRGMANADLPMVTSLRRNCKDLQRALEPAILKNFAKYAVMEDPTIAQSVWRQMFLGQHHGLPTRLLDWTQSALVALHFAVSEDNLEHMDEHDCMVWRTDIKELHALLPPKYQEVMSRSKAEVFSVDMLGQAASNIAAYDHDMGDRSMVVLEPPSIDSRIVNQYSFFCVVPMDMEDIEGFLDRYTKNTVKYVIDRSLRWRVRDMLDQLNMSERLIYPGLDGLSRWIARHYFVKAKPQDPPAASPGSFSP
ncbi:MAG: FRG domain-containing protein [Oscillospiraceae bacterium]|nr:FRG domain-containing protein [Oscillospiraceae bacterium]